MAARAIPPSSLEANLEATLTECADTGQPVVIELPDERIVAIQALDPDEVEDSLIDDLLESNPAFQELVARSSASPRKPFESLTG